MTTFQTTCSQCRTIFEASRSAARYCGSTCRNKAADARNRAAFVAGLRARLTRPERDALAAYLAPGHPLLPASLADLSADDLIFVSELAERANLTPYSMLHIVRHAQRNQVLADHYDETLPDLQETPRV